MTRHKNKLADKDYASVRRALNQMTRRYSGQLKDLSEAAGINYGRLRRSTSDVETTREGRALTLVEALRLMEAAGDFSLLNAICAELGFETPKRILDQGDEAVGCGALISETLSVSSSLGVLSATVKDAVADSRLSENERRNILEALENSQKDLEKIRRLVSKIV